MCADHRNPDRRHLESLTAGPSASPPARSAAPARRPAAARRGSRRPPPGPPSPATTVARYRARSAGSSSGDRSPSAFARSNRSRRLASAAARRALSSCRIGLGRLAAGERALHRQASRRMARVGQAVGDPAQESLGDRPRRRLADRLAIELRRPAQVAIQRLAEQLLLVAEGAVEARAIDARSRRSGRRSTSPHSPSSRTPSARCPGLDPHKTCEADPSPRLISGILYRPIQ